MRKCLSTFALFAIILALAACSDSSDSDKGGSPQLTQSEVSGVVNSTQGDALILATALENDQVLGELLALLNLSGSVVVTGNDGPTLHKPAPQQATGEADYVLLRGKYEYNAQIGELTLIAPPTETEGKLIITTIVETQVGPQEVELEVDWDVDTDTVVAALTSFCVDGSGCEVVFYETPISMEATIELGSLPIAEASLSADYFMTTCGYLAEPSSLSISGSVGVSTVISLNSSLAITDTGATDTITTRGAVGVIAGKDSASVNWEISASGNLTRDPDTCLITGFKPDNGGMTLGFTESVGDEESNLEFNLDVHQITYDESGLPISAVIVGNLKVNGKIAVTFAGIFDDADGSGIPGENVTLTFADGMISLEAFIRAHFIESAAALFGISR